MRYDEFSYFLMNECGIQKHTATDIKSRCRRVETQMKVLKGAEFDLDSMYLDDKCESVLNYLVFSNRESFSSTNLPQTVAGLSDMRHAVKKYIMFCNHHAPEIS